jgi:cytochrome b pre-mRNA-processing protein 3
MIVAQARSSGFYAGLGVPDSVDGRFDMIVLHLVLAMRRLDASAGENRSFSQGLFDHFCRDLDGNLREMGVGDLAVPKEMRRLGGAFYGRQTAYNAALVQANDEQLENALARNIFNSPDGIARARLLAAYVRAAVRLLDAQHDRDLLRGAIDFPDLEAFSE